MRIERKEGSLIFVDGKKLTSKEKEYTFACFRYGVLWYSTDDDSVFRLADFYNVISGECYVGRAIRLAKEYGITVSEDAQALYEELKTAAESEQGRRERLRIAEEKRTRWRRRKESGCADCQQCKQVGDGDFRCEYSGDLLDSRIGEYWDPIDRIHYMFYEIGEPNEHCKDYFKETTLKGETN